MNDLDKIAAKLPLSAGVRARNPHLAATETRGGGQVAVRANGKAWPLPGLAHKMDLAGKRIRQGEAKLSKWEKEWEWLVRQDADFTHVKAQSLRFRLANGGWYKPDVSALSLKGDCKVHCWEVKGGAKMKGAAKGVLALKVAASQYPEFKFVLVWKERGGWRSQEVQP